MTDPQIMTLALAIVIPLSMLIYSNSRITEAKETLRAEIGQLRSDLTLTIEGRFNAMETRFNAIDRKLDEILRMLGDHETRITRLEQRPH
jgi:chromosome segregation ATPase